MYMQIGILRCNYIMTNTIISSKFDYTVKTHTFPTIIPAKLNNVLYLGGICLAIKRESACKFLSPEPISISRSGQFLKLCNPWISTSLLVRTKTRQG